MSDVISIGLRPKIGVPVGRAQLDEDLARLEPCPCDQSECGGSALELRPRCHPDSPMKGFYRDGQFALRCDECDHLVLLIWVGEAPPS